MGTVLLREEWKERKLPEAELKLQEMMLNQEILMAIQSGTSDDSFWKTVYDLVRQTKNSREVSK